MSMGTTTGVDASAGQATVPFSADVGAPNTSMAFAGGGAVPANAPPMDDGGGGSGLLQAIRGILKDPAVMKEISGLGSKYAGLMAAEGKMSPNTRSMLAQVMGGGKGQAGAGSRALAEGGIDRMALAEGMTQFLTPEMASQMLMGAGIPTGRMRF